MRLSMNHFSNEEIPGLMMLTMKNLFSICVCFLIISIVAEQSENAEEEFIPTDEWQTVKEGQKIPPGLHVRLNLQTGLREAKLLDEDAEDTSSSNPIIPVSPDAAQEEISRRNLEQAFANLDSSKDDVPRDETHEEEVRQKYRPYEELKKEFESLNMKIQTDQEIITNLIEQLNTTNDNDNRKTILTDLEYYLHQYDNAVLFADLNGLDLLMHLLNSTEINTEIRLLTCLTLGAAFQGNPQVQRKALNLGFLQYILRLLNTETNDVIILRLLFTLSTLLRNYPQSQQIFLEHGGAELMVKLVDQSNLSNKIVVRIVTLMNDLIIEKDQMNENNRQVYANIQLREQLVDHGWCSHLSTRLNTFDINEFDSIDKLITAMISLIDSCRQEFLSLMTTLDKLNVVYTTMNPTDDLSYSDILQNIEILRRKLHGRSSDDL